MTACGVSCGVRFRRVELLVDQVVYGARRLAGNSDGWQHRFRCLRFGAWRDAEAVAAAGPGAQAAAGEQAAQGLFDAHPAGHGGSLVTADLCAGGEDLRAGLARQFVQRAAQRLGGQIDLEAAFRLLRAGLRMGRRGWAGKQGEGAAQGGDDGQQAEAARLAVGHVGSCSWTCALRPKSTLQGRRRSGEKNGDRRQVVSNSPPGFGLTALPGGCCHRRTSTRNGRMAGRAWTRLR